MQSISKYIYLEVRRANKEWMILRCTIFQQINGLNLKLWIKTEVVFLLFISLIYSISLGVTMEKASSVLFKLLTSILANGKRYSPWIKQGISLRLLLAKTIKSMLLEDSEALITLLLNRLKCTIRRLKNGSSCPTWMSLGEH